MAELTPLMRQYWEIKSLHQDKILFFRMGDFYEMFFDDAVTAAPLLGIALTSRNKKSADETPMCGIPYHSVAGPIQKLISLGHKVAICDQIEDPKLAKGIVKRAVTRVLTPGMVLDPESLETTRSHYIAACESGVLACIDVTTGESFYFENLVDTEIEGLVSLLPIVEWVVSDIDQGAQSHSHSSGSVVSFCHELASREHPAFGHIQEQVAPRRLLAYVQTLAGTGLTLVLKPFERRTLKGRMRLSESTLRHLEIFSTYKGETQGSFFHAVNRTQTSVGARLLRQWISFPLLDQGQIHERLDQVTAWKNDLGRLKSLRDLFRTMGDLERRLSKTGQPSASARDLVSLRDSGKIALEALALAGQLGDADRDLETLFLQIERTIVDEPPLLVRQGYMIRKGFSEELDELILLTTDSQALLEQLESRERTQTGISSLKVRYNQVFGYYIEVTNTHKDKVPSHYMRKQTLANAERYCTDELIELEKKVLSAQSRRNDLEYEIFESLRRKILKHSALILGLATRIARLDVITSFAWLALECRYTQPTFSASQALCLVGSRHPVVEQAVPQFVANRIEVDAEGCLLITGPNMAGKSTLMRQVALTALMAQMGSYVAAETSVLPLFDQILTRIGASDQLSEGLSTFMVEMTETAQILKIMTSKSLVIFDEIGRGTSTFDGMSLAQGILEFLLGRARAMTFFATHYHELTQLESSFPRLKNVHMSVVEKNGDVRFLHTLAKGPALKSYGIAVAKLAGLPAEITKRATEILKHIESKQEGLQSSQLSLFQVASCESSSDSVMSSSHATVLDDLKAYPLSSKTPLEALVQIEKWQNEICSRSSQKNH